MEYNTDIKWDHATSRRNFGQNAIKACLASTSLLLHHSTNYNLCCSLWRHTTRSFYMSSWLCRLHTANFYLERGLEWRQFAAGFKMKTLWTICLWLYIVSYQVVRGVTGVGAFSSRTATLLIYSSLSNISEQYFRINNWNQSIYSSIIVKCCPIVFTINSSLY